MIDAYRRTGRLDGQCLCGDVTVKIDGDYVAAVGVCHCSMCRTWSGCVSGLFEASRGAVTVAGPVQTYASSAFAERAFCRTCGTSLWMRNTQPEGEYEFLPALFPGADEFPLISEIYIDCAPAYGALQGDHKTATQAQYEAKNQHVAKDES